MFTIDVEKIELLKKAIEQNKVPQFVYKYYKLNEFTELVLEESKIWFGSPEKFNDPFDSQLVPDTTNSKKEIDKYLAENTVKFNRASRKEMSKKLNKSPELWRKTITESLQKISLNSGITSFCGSNDNILMWAHYSDSHKGICMKFDLSLSPETFVFPIKINYTDKYPKFNYLKNTEDIIEFLFQTKAMCWEYEQELRVVKPKLGKYPFSKKSLVGVTFGCKTEKKDIERYTKILHDKKYSVDIFQTHPSDKEFKLELKKLQTTQYLQKAGFDI